MINGLEKKLVIIAGANRGIGRTFLEYYQSQERTTVQGINRSGSSGNKLDLMNEEAVHEFVDGLNLETASEVIYLHSIGVMKFEPKGKPEIDRDLDGIDDEVYASNYQTLVNFAEPLIERTHKLDLPLTICTIGSISDLFKVPFWQSFYRAKNLMRAFCKTIPEKNVASIVLNVGSMTDGKESVFGRTQADTRYWQTSQELLEKSISLLDSFQQLRTPYAEFDFYKHNPLFREDHYTNLPKLYAQWARDMGYKGKQIPLGIRI